MFLYDPLYYIYHTVVLFSVLSNLLLLSPVALLYLPKQPPCPEPTLNHLALVSPPVDLDLAILHDPRVIIQSSTCHPNTDRSLSTLADPEGPVNRRTFVIVWRGGVRGIYGDRSTLTRLSYTILESSFGSPTCHCDPA